MDCTESVRIRWGSVKTSSLTPNKFVSQTKQLMWKYHAEDRRKLQLLLGSPMHLQPALVLNNDPEPVDRKVPELPAVKDFEDKDN
jgi:hypothetical protein